MASWYSLCFVCLMCRIFQCVSVFCVLSHLIYHRWNDGCAHASISLSGIVVKTYYCFYYFNFSVLDVNWLFVLFLYVLLFFFFFFSRSVSLLWKSKIVLLSFLVFIVCCNFCFFFTTTYTPIHKIESSMKKRFNEYMTIVFMLILLTFKVIKSSASPKHSSDTYVGNEFG